MNKIIPTVFAKNKKDFDKRFKLIIKLSKDIQIDFMDGKFVKSKSISIKDIPNLNKYNNNFEIHLMAEKPEEYIDDCVNKGFKKIIAHVETVNNYYEMIKHVKNHSVKIFLALNPETNINKVIPWMKDIDGVLLMGVKPGKEHQKLIIGVYEKARSLRKKDKKVDIQVDGGVALENIGKLAKAGINLFNSGSFISESKDPKEAIILLERTK